MVEKAMQLRRLDDRKGRPYITMAYFSDRSLETGPVFIFVFLFGR